MFPSIARWTLIPILTSAVLSAVVGSAWSLLRWRTLWDTPDPPYEITNIVEWKSAAWVALIGSDDVVVEPLDLESHAGRWYPALFMLPDQTRELAKAAEPVAGADTILATARATEALSAVLDDRPWTYGLVPWGRFDREQDSGYWGGVMVQGRDSNGRDPILISLVGPQISNDHYPIVEAQWLPASGDVETQWYYVDVAGIEGITAPRVAMGAFLPLAVIAMLTTVIGIARSLMSRRPRRQAHHPVA